MGLTGRSRRENQARLYNEKNTNYWRCRIYRFTCSEKNGEKLSELSDL